MPLSNIQRLEIERISQTMASGGIGSALSRMTRPAGDDGLYEHILEARRWVAEALWAAKSAPGGERLGDDEAVAGLILDRIEENRKDS